MIRVQKAKFYGIRLRFKGFGKDSHEENDKASVSESHNESS